MDAYTEERGYPPYHLCMMLKLLLYGYCTGTYSSRRIAAKLADSVALKRLFDQVLQVCCEAGLVDSPPVAVPVPM